MPRALHLVIASKELTTDNSEELARGNLFAKQTARDAQRAKLSQEKRARLEQAIVVCIADAKQCAFRAAFYDVDKREIYSSLEQAALAHAAEFQAQLDQMN